MAINPLKKLKQQVRGMSDDELTRELDFFRSEAARTPSERHRANMLAASEVFISEAVRREERGGRREKDIRGQYLSDGQRAGLGLDDRDDNP